MSNLSVFNFESHEIRFVGTADNPWWVAKDICDVFGHSDVSMMLSRLDDDEKDTKNVCTPGGNQEMLCVNESGLYSLALTSRKPQAKRFKKWLTSEVIPSIRKTGSYRTGHKPLLALVLEVIVKIMGI
ncbi:Bro-N domain-containing protein [Nostoc sp. CCY 9925]|uniref:BRO-N domain-containing protein n=1 Tax=Nostoc sp. CCY 9925 TaxID=3103865 RepID=UPI0039C6975A